MSIQISADLTVTIDSAAFRRALQRAVREGLLYNRRNISSILIAPDDPWFGDFEQITMLVQQVT